MSGKKAGSGLTRKQAAMQERQTRTADAYPHPGRLPVPFGLQRRVFAAQLQQLRLYVITIRNEQTEPQTRI